MDKSNQTIKQSYSDELAERRTALAQNRSFLATERTFAAWIRTGFSLAGVGISFASFLQGVTSELVANSIGIMLDLLGMLTLVYAWIEYKMSYHFIKNTYDEATIPRQQFRLNFIYGTVLITVLLLISILGLIIIVF
ncbi:YidH family protein [Streptococcus pluranimalium]|uniref:YidH family protein n=1 Tax=Streptococcus pluranimalium TaxID=82348 RepID=UPI0039EB75DD